MCEVQSPPPPPSAGEEGNTSLRAWFDLRTRSSQTGTSAGLDAEVSERRASLGLAWTPSKFLMLSAELPLISRTWFQDGFEPIGGRGLGDLDTRVVVTPLSPRWQEWDSALSVGVSARIPIGAELVDEGGEELPHEAQPSEGGLGAGGGVTLTLGTGPWRFTSSTWAFHWWEDSDGDLPGDMFSSQLLAGHTFGDKVTLRIGGDVTTSGSMTSGMDHDSMRLAHTSSLENTGGTLLFVRSDVQVSIARVGQLQGGVAVPVIQKLNGEHTEGSILNLGISRMF